MRYRSAQWQGSTSYLTVAASTIFALTLAACGSVQHSVSLQSGYTAPAGAKVEVGRVSNESGAHFEVDAEQLLRDALAERLRREDMLWTGESGPKLVITSKIIEYEEGSAFKRWLLPGWGSTILGVQCDLRDGTHLVGTAQARRTISIGGAYSAGAWKTIFADVANDLVNDLHAQIR